MTITPTVAGLQVDVTGGRISGVTARGLQHWRGIPYAAPPVDALRLRAPQPVVPWRGVRDASRFGSVPWQKRSGQTGASSRTPRSEDCLTINVVAPTTPSRVPRPVMVFIHGGAYAFGSSREIPRLGEALVVEGDIIFVNLNYRLNALGYLDFSRYSTPERPFDSNLGLRDQVAALEWIRDNIGAFGGDPDNVTLFGESAGGNAISTLLAVPAAAGLFARGIIESASPEAVYSSSLTAQWAADYLGILREVTRDDTTPEAVLLDTVDATTLVEAATLMQIRTPDAVPGSIAFCPVIDGDYLPQRPVEAAAAGRTHAIPLIIGTNALEGSLFKGSLDLLATTRPRIRALFAKTERQARSRLFDEYRALPKRTSAAAFGGDYTFWYPSIRYAEGHAVHAAVYFYRFDVTTPALKMVGLDATHGLELFAVFDLADTPVARAAGLLGGRAAFKVAGARMRARWLGFARDGSPGEDWTPYSSVDRATLIIDAQDRMELDPNRSRRLAWDAFVPHL